MSEEAAFENAILASPNDDTVRLVFADWLDERGDARGQFLRAWFALRQVSESLAVELGETRRDEVFEGIDSVIASYQSAAAGVDRAWLWRLGTGRAWVDREVALTIVRWHLLRVRRKWWLATLEESGLERAWMFADGPNGPGRKVRKEFQPCYLVHKFLGTVGQVGSAGPKLALWDLEGRP